MSGLIARTGLPGVVLLAVAACQLSGAPGPATLDRVTPDNLQVLKSVLADVTRQGRVDLGPGDLTRESAISVLPPPIGLHEGNSLAMPTWFDLVTDGSRCFVRQRTTGDLHPLPGVSCRRRPA